MLFIGLFDGFRLATGSRGGALPEEPEARAEREAVGECRRSGNRWLRGLLVFSRFA